MHLYYKTNETVQNNNNNGVLQMVKLKLPDKHIWLSNNYPVYSFHKKIKIQQKRHTTGGCFHWGKTSRSSLTKVNRVFTRTRHFSYLLLSVIVEVYKSINGLSPCYLKSVFPRKCILYNFRSASIIPQKKGCDAVYKLFVTLQLSC